MLLLVGHEFPMTECMVMVNSREIVLNRIKDSCVGRKPALI
jgi:hypothetical protein